MKHSSIDSGRDMPEHLLFNILLWLPVASLLRFKSACKSWYALIDSPIFISQHFNHNSGNDNLLGVCVDILDDQYKQFCLLSDNKYEVFNDFDCGQTWHVVDRTKLAFCSNGIVCLVDYIRNISLWNPAMKQLRSLPKSPVPCQDYVYTFFGFGFNVKTNDHNFVRTTFCNKNASKNLVEVYSLRTASWSTMYNDFAMPYRFYKSFNYHITKDGTCFWIAYPIGDVDTDGNVILSFDLNDEAYETMPLPVGEVPFSAVIYFLGDKIAYIHGVGIGSRMNGYSYYEVWVLHEYGVKESWNKAWKVGPIDIPGTDNVLWPSSFICNGQFLLLTDNCLYQNSGIFCLCHLGTNENSYLEPHRHNLCFRWSIRYRESLFPVIRVNDAH